ncbi:MAG TPA: hypothetical protein VIF60_06790 [Burkholderiaceae bacterium]|jgi:hypothetical protein
MPDAPSDGTRPDTPFYGCKGAPPDLIPQCLRTPSNWLFRSTWGGSELVGWKASIHVLHWASRIDLEVNGLRDISQADTLAEGIGKDALRDLQ